MLNNNQTSYLTLQCHLHLGTCDVVIEIIILMIENIAMPVILLARFSYCSHFLIFANQQKLL